MKKVFGVLLLIAGIAAGVYAGLWWAFVGGIVQVIEAFQATPIDAMDVALGVLRVMCSGFIGGLVAFVACVPGYVMATE
jgi:uncharacterized membrane protein